MTAGGDVWHSSFEYSDGYVFIDVSRDRILERALMVLWKFLCFYVLRARAEKHIYTYDHIINGLRTKYIFYMILESKFKYRIPQISGGVVDVVLLVTECELGLNAQPEEMDKPPFASYI